MKQKLCLGLCLLGLLGGVGRAGAQTTSVLYDQALTPYNVQALGGEPISTTPDLPSTNNTHTGSNGKMPTSDSSAGSFNRPTTNQFASWVSFGSVCAPTNQAALNLSTNFLNGRQAFSGAVAQAMQLPVGLSNNVVVIVMQNVTLGASFSAAPVNYLLGSVISPPNTDVYGVLLPAATSTAYWQPGPWTNSASTNATPYYYSPNSGWVNATQPGQIQITWITQNSYSDVSTLGYVNPGGSVYPNFLTNGSQIYLLYTATYIVSSQPVKTPQNMYWTEGPFENLGYPISVPSARVTAVHVAYNPTFPQTVPAAYVDPNVTPATNPTNMLQEFRTLWFDPTEKQIRAYNQEGTVFIELLGAPIQGGSASQYLGFEIVKVSKAAQAVVVTNYLGEQLTPFSDGFEGQNLFPWAINNTLGTQYYFSLPNASTSTLFADKLTTGPNDLQVYWLSTGVAGLQWPNLLDGYNLIWPSDPAQYSHYVRPLVATAAMAAQTAVQLDGIEAPALDYQDPLDQPRGFLTTSNTFFTWLSTTYPAHRALLRFNAGNAVRFERVFSYLGQGLQDNALLANSVATNLTAWNSTNDTLTNYARTFNPPYVTNLTAYVGQSLTDPPGELGSTNGIHGDYWAGYLNTNLNASPLVATLNTNLGNSYDPYAYVDPFAKGFTAANAGTIIPVNAIPGQNLLEVWWFRPNNADPAQGFQTVYWPAIIADYTLEWPDPSTNQIVLASNDGTGPLAGGQAAGTIYRQADPTLPGYNPNEEHAVMLGGQAYALRDDLNQTNVSPSSPLPFGGYSSAPFVLVAYTGDDGRPAMSVFPVVRENPAAGILFDYVVTAGTVLQPPMPLPLLAPPVAANTNYPIGVTNYNIEPLRASGDLPTGWDLFTSPNGAFSLYSHFTFQDRTHNFWVYRGVHAGLPSLQAGYYDTNAASWEALPAGTAVVNQPYQYCIHVSRTLPSLTVGAAGLPAGLAVQEDATNGLSLVGTPTSTGSYPITVTVQDTDGSGVSAALTLNVVGSGTNFAPGPLVITSTNPYSQTLVTYSNRPPSLAAAPTPTNSFTMRFYYPTLPGFDWPELGNASNWPAVGSIVPYLRPITSVSQGIVYRGDPTSSNTPSLDIVYRPVWPTLGSDGQSPLPTLKAGQTLTTAINGLAAVRGQDSVQVLYQQSIATNSVLTNSAASVVLFDPESQKKSSLAALGGLPPSVVTDTYLGLDYFPNLPPNLISRVWYDPVANNLVLTGQYVHDVVNGDYVMLNVLRGDDLAAVNGLCTASGPSDPVYKAWTNAVAQLATPVYTFHQNPAIPGSYVDDPKQTIIRYAGDLLIITNSDTAVTSYALSAAGPGEGYISYVVANGSNPKYASDPVEVYIARVAPPLYPGSLVVVNAANASPFSQLITFQHTSDLAGKTAYYTFDWRIEPPVNGQPPLADPSTWPTLFQLHPGPVYTLGAQGIQGMSDNYVAMRYGFTNAATGQVVWSAYATQFAPGWIKRVTQNLDPVAGEAQNLFENPANTTASIIALAGPRWNGNVPLNAASLTNNGLIQLYETVLNIGKSLSINAGINYGPANQALLLAAGYLNDFYVTLGNDAWANSLNPTIGFGTDNTTYGSIATSQFVFEGQEPTLLEQNLALLRGRDDSLAPGANVPPVYHRLWWNYTYGLAAGEVMYALNYNITDQNGDGVVNAADAAIVYPQGHGDAYGHYLTALMNYYGLLMNPNFDWVPEATTVSVLGADVTVNYQDEQKFAATAAALARTGRQVFDLTWREGYVPGTANGWGAFSTNHPGNHTYVNNQSNTVPITRYWGLDHWASRVARGSYLNWVVGNAILPPKDSNPNDQGVQIVDRTTVRDLQEIPATLTALENDVDSANAGFTPLGLAQNAIPFDIDPNSVTGANPQTHFEQIYARAVRALNNAVTAFNAAQTVTTELRQQQNSLTDLKAAVTAQEQAYNDQLIGLYGTPYPDDIGAGQTFPQGYTGPDLIHYMYVDYPATNLYGGALKTPFTNQTFKVDIQSLPSDWASNIYENFDFITSATSENYTQNKDYITFNVGPDGFSKPASWQSERASVGSIQTAATAVNAAQDAYRAAVKGAQSAKKALDHAVAVFNAQTQIQDTSLADNISVQSLNYVSARLQTAYTLADAALQAAIKQLNAADDIALAVTPTEAIFGTADGGDLAKLALIGPLTLTATSIAGLQAADSTLFVANQVQLLVNASLGLGLSIDQAVNSQNLTQIAAVQSLATQESAVSGALTTINQAENTLNGAQANYQTLVSQGNRIQAERLTFRQHTAAQVQGDTVANSAFLVFQNENLQRYTTLFNLAQEYAWMAANAYDYETGLLGTPAGQAYLNQIISSSALGVVQNGQPQVSGTGTGDPGLANALAEMYADFEVLKGRLGFNNPDGYSTTASLRQENYRINADSTGDNNWQQVLQQGLVPDLLADTDVKRNCLGLDDGTGAAVPGIELTFSTTITDGQNLFGQPAGPGDHAFSTSSFATKIFSVGVCFDGYVGMDNPTDAGGTTPADPTLDPNGLEATPYVYLIPCGADSMRSPPLGDASTIRTWNVDDVVIPLPYNIGASDFSSKPYYAAADSLTEPLYAIRKMQAFRPVSTTSAFDTSIYGGGALQRTEYTNQRLIGRSVWNSKWKLIIPGKTLLADPNQGLARFINSVKDVHLYFVTYSYSGN